MEIATQLTLLQHYRFQSIPLNEFLTSKKDNISTPFYVRIKDLHNHIALWILNIILVKERIEDRIDIVEFCIQVS